jgi:acyl-CoA thioester hydrolase
MQVRFSDCDLYGHLNNIWYVKYFLDAREDHIAQSYGLTLADFAQRGVGWVVSTNHIAYLKSAKVNERVVLRSAVINFQDNQILVEMQMLDEHRTHVKSVMWSTFVHVGLKDGRRINHSIELTELFSRVKVGGYEHHEFDKRLIDLRSEFQKNTVKE